MSELREALERYLSLRRTLGFKLRSPAGTLQQFVDFAESEGASTITTDLVLRWATTPGQAQLKTRSRKLNTVRRFALWQSATDPHTEVPPEGLLPYRDCRPTPYIFSDEETERLISTAAKLPSYRGLRGITYSTLFGLLTATGMRLSEAVALDQSDIDFPEGILTIRQAKFGKSRLAPLHPTTSEAIRQYIDQRDRALGHVSTQALFISERNRRITGWAARYNFARVSQQIGLRAPARGHGWGPRLHDLRHRFAVRTLIDWYRAGLDVEREMPKLATYLGHVHARYTYWYIEAVPELLQLATKRLMRRREEDERI